MENDVSKFIVDDVGLITDIDEISKMQKRIENNLNRDADTLKDKVQSLKELAPDIKNDQDIKDIQESVGNDKVVFDNILEKMPLGHVCYNPSTGGSECGTRACVSRCREAGGALESLFTRSRSMHYETGGKEGDLNNPEWDDINRLLENTEMDLMDSRIAMEDKDIHGLIVGMAKTISSAYRATSILGIDMDDVMSYIKESDETFFISNSDELVNTVKHYAAQGIKTLIKGDFPRVYVITPSGYQMGIGGEMIRGNTPLKSVNWEGIESKVKEMLDKLTST